MEAISIDFAAEAVRGEKTADIAQKITSVENDARLCRPGSLFVAVRGEQFDGHDFIADAFKNGAVAALSEKSVVNAAGPLIIVKNTRQALMDLAGAYRRLFSLPVVAVTGSVGKTSTKEMIYAVLSRSLKTHKNEGNRNNQIGMPLSVFGLQKTHEAAVFEMGMSGFGEISSLSRIARPQIAVVTNIGISHIGLLGSREGILKAKLEILDGLSPDGTLLLNADDDMLSKLTVGVKTVSYGIENEKADFRAKNIKTYPDRSEFDIVHGAGAVRAEVPCAGRHNIYNALAAFAVGRMLGIPAGAVVSGLAGYVPAGMRQKVVKRGGRLFIEDCYNASPDSMKAAFGVLAGMPVEGKRIAVLADMRELGDYSAHAHREVGKEAAENGIDVLLCFGEYAPDLCRGFLDGGGEKTRCRAFEDKAKIQQALLNILECGDAVLFKGSRAMKLEDVIHGVYAALPEE